MIVLGLTGSMATGKSTVVQIIKALYQIPVWDADVEVRRLLAQPRVKEKVALIFPNAIVNGSLNRTMLRKHVFENPSQLKYLEEILYPLLWKQVTTFVKFQRRQRRKIVILDVPLLFEKGWSSLCDYVLVASCKSYLQRQRIMRRAGMTIVQMDKILDQQLPQSMKMSLANFVIFTDQHKGYIALQLKRVFHELGVFKGRNDA